MAEFNDKITWKKFNDLEGLNAHPKTRLFERPSVH